MRRGSSISPIVLCLVSALLLAAGCRSRSAFRATAQTAEPVCFVQISDTHFGSPGSAARTAAAIERINGIPLPVRCVVHTGDLTSDRLEDEQILNEALGAFKQVRVPVHFLPGNHDIPAKRSDRTARVYTNRVGRLVSWADYGDLRFVFACTEPLAHSFRIKGYDPLDELEAVLAAAGNRPVLLFHHTPSVEDFYKNKMHPGWDADVRQRWVNLVNRYNVRAVIAGHFHRDEMHWLGDVPLHVCAPVVGFWGRQATFRIYEYSNGRLSYRTQYLE